MEKVPSGSKIVDKLLDGGYENDVITTIYGPAGAGKTNLCLLASMTMARSGKKVIYVDTESNFSLERFRQLCTAIHHDYQNLINNIVVLQPASFDEQKKTFLALKDMVNDKIGLVVVDSIAMLYRLEMGKDNDIYETNKELGKQVAYLTETARKRKIPVLVSNQVYADFEDKEKVNLVGGDLLKYGSKCLLELQITKDGNRKLIIRKHRSLESARNIIFRIVEGGILGTTEPKPEPKPMEFP
jgi:DNA repair protein RadB